MGVFMCFLIVTPFAGYYIWESAAGGDGKTRLSTHFGGLINPDSVVRHRFRIAGFGDSDDFWKLKLTDANDCERIIRKFSLASIEHDWPSSLMSAPWWWPRSTKSYCVYQGSDGYDGGIELWIPKEGSNVYLYKFTE